MRFQKLTFSSFTHSMTYNVYGSSEHVLISIASYLECRWAILMVPNHHAKLSDGKMSLGSFNVMGTYFVKTNDIAFSSLTSLVSWINYTHLSLHLQKGSVTQVGVLATGQYTCNIQSFPTNHHPHPQG